MRAGIACEASETARKVGDDGVCPGAVWAEREILQAPWQVLDARIGKRVGSMYLKSGEASREEGNVVIQEAK